MDYKTVMQAKNSELIWDWDRVLDWSVSLHKRPQRKKKRRSLDSKEIKILYFHLDTMAKQRWENISLTSNRGCTFKHKKKIK